MAELKTKLNDRDVEAFLHSVEDEAKKKDSFEILEIMKSTTGEKPKMWGTSIVGFGSYHYKYKSGREGDWFKTGFSPRKQSMTVYIMQGFNKYGELLIKLGKYKTGKACLYFKKLEDVDKEVLKTLISHSVDYLTNKYG
jgi:hypothetical protein